MLFIIRIENNEMFFLYLIAAFKRFFYFLDKALKY